MNETRPCSGVMRLAMTLWLGMAAGTALAECVIVDADFTRGKPADSRLTLKGGDWSQGWRVVGEFDQMVLDAGYDIKNGYFEAVVTRRGELTFGERKRNWMAALACLEGHQCPGGMARTGSPMYDFSKAEIFAASQKNTICESKFGRFSDWVPDDRTQYVVRAEIRNNVMTWTNNKGGKTACGSAAQPVTHFRYSFLGGVLDHKTGWHHGSLAGLRVLRATVVDYDMLKGCKPPEVKRKPLNRS